MADAQKFQLTILFCLFYSYSTTEAAENVIDDTEQMSTSEIQVLMLKVQLEMALSGRLCAI